MGWRNELRKCDCGQVFNPRREAQAYCSPRCGTKYRVARHRSRYVELTLTQRPGSRYIGSSAPLQGSERHSESTFPPLIWPERDFTSGHTPGALQGDDYQLEYYEDGYPKLPSCLKRGAA